MSTSADAILFDCSASSRATWNQWHIEEVPFVSAQRPWERADLIIAGTPTLHHDPEQQLVVAEPSATTP
jgi:hypothetical protein